MTALVWILSLKWKMHQHQKVSYDFIYIINSIETQGKHFFPEPFVPYYLLSGWIDNLNILIVCSWGSLIQ